MAALVWAVAGAVAVSLALDEPGQLARWMPAAALACLTAWAVFWAPKVIVGADGLDIRNVVASHHVPWAAIARIDTKWALTLYTAQGKVTAFAAPAPSNLRPLRGASSADIKHLPESAFDAARSVRPGDLPGTPSGDLAWVVRERWEQVRDQGPTGTASGQQATRRWHTATILLWLALAAAAAAAPALTA
ncbi:MAG: PH domain-containing protein [Bifidobacteriaceae bacterium]|jgi:hypothetical protein|nr:PH domain-containing protein [Bifidobacteriaceae bacterium]